MEAERKRNRQMYEEYLAGASLAELAKKYSVSHSRVRGICKMEKIREEHTQHEVFQIMFALSDDEQIISKTITILKRLGATTIPEVLKLDRKTLKKTRNCGDIMTEFIMKVQEELKRGMCLELESENK